MGSPGQMSLEDPFFQKAVDFAFKVEVRKIEGVVVVCLQSHILK